MRERALWVYLGICWAVPPSGPKKASTQNLGPSLVWPGKKAWKPIGLLPYFIFLGYLGLAWPPGQLFRPRPRPRKVGISERVAHGQV
jgi:hypothetical protein